jgi:hypothetical protein
MTNTENVVFRYRPEADPGITYRGVPSGCSGSGPDLGAARVAYRCALSELLHLDRHELPHVVEHLEAVVEGMWVRTKVGSVHRDHTGDRMFLQALLAPGRAQQELRAQVEQDTNRGLDPVVVIVEADDTVGSVLDQMAPHDTVVIAWSDPEVTVGWAVIYGPEVHGRHDVSWAVDDAGLREMSISELARRYGAGTLSLAS